MTLSLLPWRSLVALVYLTLQVANAQSVCAATPQDAKRLLTTGNSNPFSSSSTPAASPSTRPSTAPRAWPAPRASKAPRPATRTSQPPAPSGGSVNINTADADTLARTLKGIGPVKAAAIIQDRQQNGPFRSVEDLDRVKGIGAATIEKNRALLSTR